HLRVMLEGQAAEGVRETLLAVAVAINLARQERY
ncbi:unnamed protein product, partial [marine sediment metagenome]